MHHRSRCVRPLTARQALQGLPQLFALLQDVVELVKVPTLPPVPGRVLHRPRHWTETQLFRLISERAPPSLSATAGCTFVQTGFCESERGMETHVGK